MPPSKEFLDLIGKMQEIHVKKNKDYSGDNDAFFNFDFTAKLVAYYKSPIDQVFVSLIGIKLARLSVLLDGNASVNNEPIEDSFLDAANYMTLWGARRSRDFKPKENTPITTDYLDNKSLMLSNGFVFNNAHGKWYNSRYDVSLEATCVVEWGTQEIKDWITRIKMLPVRDNRPKE